MNTVSIRLGSSRGAVKHRTPALARNRLNGRTRTAIRFGTKLAGALLALGWLPSAGAAFECPQSGKGAVPALISPAEEKLLAAGGEDMANEAGELIVRLKGQRPSISMEEITNELVAAYCPIIARTSLSTEAKQDRVDTFGALVRKRLASEVLAPGSSIVAAIPLTPDVYRALQDKAKQAGQTPSEFMSAILTKAAAAPGK